MEVLRYLLLALLAHHGGRRAYRQRHLRVGAYYFSRWESVFPSDLIFLLETVKMHEARLDDEAIATKLDWGTLSLMLREKSTEIFSLFRK